MDKKTEHFAADQHGRLAQDHAARAAPACARAGRVPLRDQTTLAKLAPLLELRSSGSDLVPVFMEFGPELAKYFELDTARLDRVINDGVEDPRKRVDLADIELLTLASMEERGPIARPSVRQTPA